MVSDFTVCHFWELSWRWSVKLFKSSQDQFSVQNCPGQTRSSGGEKTCSNLKPLHNQGAGQWHPTNKTGATGGPESFFWEAGRRFYFEKCEFDVKFTGQRVGQWHPINIFLFKTDHWGPESFFREAGRRFYTHPISFFFACPNNQCLSLSGLVGADPFNFIFERQGSQIDWKSGSARDGYASEKEMGGGHI